MSHNSRSRTRSSDETNPQRGNHLSLDLDVKRIVPSLNDRNGNQRRSDDHRRNSDDVIVPSLGLHMLQTGSGTVKSRQSGGGMNVSNSISPEVDRKGDVRGDEDVYLGDVYDDSSNRAQGDKKKPQSRTRSLFLLLLFVAVLIVSASTILSEDTNSTNNVKLSLDETLQHGYTLLRKAISFFLTKFNTNKPLPLTQLQKRLQLGQSLLHNDPLGAFVTCSSVSNAILRHYENNIVSDSISSSVMTVVAFLEGGEDRLLAEALLCGGDAKLALFSFGGRSTAGWSDIGVNKSELLRAKDSLEAAISVDPTNAAIRASLGLTLLLLGTVDNQSTTESQTIIQYLVQSVNHLKVASDMSAGSNELIHLTSMHNLGLAHLALDGVRNGQESQFLDFISSIETPSSVLLMNKGSRLLEVGKTNDAVDILNVTAEELSCSIENIADSDVGGRSRRKEVCSLLQQNLVLADDVLHGDQTGITENITDLAKSDDSNVSVSHTISDDSISEVSSNSNDTSLVTNDGSSADLSLEERNVTETFEEDIESTSLNEVDKDVDHKSPKLQNALHALENAANDGVQRPRLLLALAKARASTGDVSGAIDATLTAINHATSAEETEMLTTYLEKLMGILTGESSSESNHRVEQSENTDTNQPRGRTISELELSLEIEKLKYRVLEQEHALKYQEMRLTGDQNQKIDYAAMGRAIDYSPESTDYQTISKASIPSKVISNHEKVQPQETVDLVDNHVDSDESPQLDSDSISSNDLEEEESLLDANSTTVEAQESEVALNKTDEETLVNETASLDDQPPIDEENSTTKEPIVLPSLFDPPLKPPGELSATAKSYMKIADAYLDKGKYALASKQFLKVIRKAPDHLAAHLGYATALERAGKNKQMIDAAAAYGDAFKVAVAQSDKVDPLAKAGTGGMPESILRRAVQIAQTAPSGRLELLRTLSTYAHTAALAADVYYAIGIELTKQGTDQESTKTDAIEAFAIANGFITMRNDADTPYHVLSTIEMGKIALDQGNVEEAIDYFEKVKSLHLDDEDHVKLLVLSGRAHSAAGAIEIAIADLTRALSFPQCQSTASAHHELAIVLGKNNGDAHEIQLHFEKALDLGMDPTDEALAALGEHNISIMKSYNRQYYRQMNEGHHGSSSSGGVMSGGGVGSQKSVFAPQAGKAEESSAQEETLSLLEQGAASYDGHVPMGGEVEGGGDSSLSHLSGRKRS